MFQRLKEKWQVSWTQFTIIFCTFAAGGSLCGYAGRKLMGLTNLEGEVVYIIIYILLITLLWPLCVLIVSIPMGQFAFFSDYLHRVWKRIVQQEAPALKHQQQAVAIFASGAGSNAEKIIRHFKGHPFITVALIVCNKPGAGVLQIAADHHIPVLLIEKEPFFRGNAYVDELKQYGVSFIVLAGFLWKVPVALIQAYPNRIINIHPALLPKYGGKGMYGMRVHEAVIAAREKESGITIHYVNEQFDEGTPIFQARCTVAPTDTPESLAQKIHALEHAHFPVQVEQLLSKDSTSFK